MRYWKRPVEVEAWPWDAWPRELYSPGFGLMSIGTWRQGAPNAVREWDESLRRVMTLESVMVASPGDWLIRGVAGEIYPCKAAIFEATYEPVSD